MTRAFVRHAAGVFAALSAPLLCAVALHAAAQGRVSLESGLVYPRPSGSAGDALTLFVNNARVAGLVVGASILAAAIPRCVRALATVLTVVAVINVALIAAVVLADGPRAEAALAGHTMIELAAYSLCAAGFMHARRHGVGSDRRLLMSSAVGALVLLGLAAVTEAGAW